MKTVVCGLGKCGSRMALDLHSLLHGGKYSYEINPNGSEQKKLNLNNIFEDSNNGFLQWLFGAKKRPISLVRNIHKDEEPPIHLGDPDGQNEVLSMCRADTGNADQDSIRSALAANIIDFINYKEACGQYHIIGEQVMQNLLSASPQVREKLIKAYIQRDNADNVSCYLLLFSTGGGTGCGTSTILAEEIANYAKTQYINMLTAGIGILPGRNESGNYKVSAGRFLTKYLARERGMYDTVFLIGNSIMEDIEQDNAQVQTRANIFASHLICSLINSSSKYHRSPINTDGPELRKNIRGLSYFCYAQLETTGDQRNTFVGLELLERALSPVSRSTTSVSASDDKRKQNMTFQGSSILFNYGKYYTAEQWADMLQCISDIRNKLKEREIIDVTELRSLIGSYLNNPKQQLPLAMRSCNNVVVLRGIPKNGTSSALNQTVLVTTLEALFPKAEIHYYYTYHSMDEETLTLIPSNFISHEIIDLIAEYLSSVWNPGITKQRVLPLLLTGKEEFSEEGIAQEFGEHEQFENKYRDFLEIKERLSGRFNLDESAWETKYVTAVDVTTMIRRLHEITAYVQRAAPIARLEEDSYMEELDI